MSDKKISVDGDICSGCGICSIICPTKCINIRANKFGEYKPEIEESKCCKCSLCLKVCPFQNNNDNEEKISKYVFDKMCDNKNKYIGYYDKIFEGYSTEYREESTSGGVNTWLLNELMERNEIEGVICVTQGENYEELFKYTLVEKKEDLKRCARTAYYPTELSKVLKILKETDKRVAIVCLPCVAKGLRLLMEKDKKFKHKIKFIFGIVCSHLPSKAMTEYIIAKQGYTSKEIEYVRFREKKYGDHYGLVIKKKNQEEKYISPQEWGIEDAFLSKNFTHISCLCCDDIFAECADITFMDAWLPKYKNNSKGYSLAVSRNKILSSIISDSLNRIIEVSEKEPIIAQRYGKLIEFKRNGISARIKLLKKYGYEVNEKRYDKINCFGYMAEYVDAKRIIENRKYLKAILDSSSKYEVNIIKRELKKKTFLLEILRKGFRIPERIFNKLFKF